jgi:insulysin
MIKKSCFWFSMFLFIVPLTFSACTFKEHKSAETVKQVNGMSFSSMTLPNELEVLLVSDSRFKKSSAAMAVMVGSMEDPENAQGLAHYLEHMLFLGTKEFPKSDEYSTYMEMNGGMDNAYTSDEVTNYFFEVDHAAIEGGLQRFSRFFVSPTFDAKFLNREKNAVNSEFEKNIKSDGWRLQRYSSLLAKEGHPAQKFSIGNTQTLANVDQATVINFYRKYYSANNMKLVIMSAEPLNKLNDWVKKYFSDVPNFHTTRPKYDDFYFSKKEENRLHFVKTIEDSENLQILFNIEDSTPFWSSKPTIVLGNLLGDEGKGSLLSYLKGKGWALGLSSGEAGWRTFGVTVTLTPDGRKNYQKVAGAVFAYIQKMKEIGYPQYLFEDLQAMRKIELDNLEPSSSGGRAAWYSRGMTDYPVNEFLERNFLIQKYSKEDFQKFLNYLDLSNAHILVTSKNEVTNEKETIFGIEYKKEKISPEFATILSEPLKDAFNYPEKNKYVPTDFSLVTRNVQGAAEKVDIGDAGTMYYQQDTELGIARSYVNVRFVSAIENSSKNYLLSYLYSICKEQELKEWAYPIMEARVQFGLIPLYADTMLFYSGGYSHRLMTTIKDLVVDKENDRRMDRCKIDAGLFGKIKAKVKKDIQNKEEDVAFQRLSEELSYFSTDKAVHWKDYLPLIDKITLADVQKFGEEFFKKTDVTVLAYGNIKPDEIKTLPAFLNETLGATRLEKAKAEAKERRFRVVPPSKEYSMLVKGRNNNYAMITSYNWGPWNIKDHAKMILLGQMISQPYFSELRTNQQLGYVARAMPTVNKGYIGLMAMLQSPKYPSLELQEKSNAFLTGLLKKKTETLTDEEIKPVKSALVNELLTKPNTLSERFGQFRDGVLNYDGQFEVNKEVAEEMKKITAKDLKDFIQQKFFDTKPAILNLFYYGAGTKIPKKLPGKVFEKTGDVKDWIYVDPYKREVKTK